MKKLTLLLLLLLSIMSVVLLSSCGEKDIHLETVTAEGDTISVEIPFENMSYEVGDKVTLKKQGQLYVKWHILSDGPHNDTSYSTPYTDHLESERYWTKIRNVQIISIQKE